MCAKKATSPAPLKSASTKASKAPTNGKAAAISTPAAKKERVLATLVIGEVAGEIWGLLAKGDAVTIAAIKKSIAAPPDVVIAGVGWLAREDKLTFTASGRTLKISLKA